ncbi:MAG: aldehyde oxidase and xanthine dehydrogenase molybdopterin binding protein [Candidatus Eremiobacteraeota bacterium]|nr:aldehyde oxidase and xanthine dehydrogenase molybdopterin binding protein [Candidatus Eremiobacteraeota bacterium]
MSTTIERPATAAPVTHVGRPLDRIDGHAKVTGAARYAADAPVGDVLYAVIVQSTVAGGRIAEIDETATRAVSGVVEVLTYRNAPKIPAFPFDFTVPFAEQLAPLQSDEIHYDGQHVALVIAETFEAAREGAVLLRITYAPGPFQATLEGAHETELPDNFFGNAMQVRRADPEAAFAASEITVDATYSTPVENHNPLEPSATVAQWRDGELIVHDASQWVLGSRAAYAKAFSVDETQVRVLAPYIGGGFGCKGFFWAHQTLAAMAAKVTGRAVKLVLSREQMFTSVGHRSSTRQRLRLGASRDGTLRAVLHDVQGESARVGAFFEPAGVVTPMLFAVPALSVSHRVAKLDIPSTTAMRAPGETPGTYALGCAMDELAYACGLDPLEVLRRNETETDGESGLPFSSRNLLACYERGAEAFDWSARTHAPRSMRDGGELIGWGVAAATYPAMRSRGEARVTIDAAGTIDVASATHDLGTGMYTILAQIAADALGADPRAIRVRIGDSAFPLAPVAGGSMSSASIGPAVHAAAERIRREVISIATSAGASPLHGLRADEVHVVDGILRAKDDPARAIAYADVVRLGGSGALEALGVAEPGKEQEEYSFHSFGAQFVEVRYDEELARLRVSRALGVFDCGRVLNAKTARSQMIGGIVWGIGMALLEETVRDDRYGAVVTNNLADYHVPVNADVPAIDVLFVEEPDLKFTALGARGMGEIGITGVAAAIANAVYHATGVRVRDLPIVPEKLLGGAAQAAWRK